MRALLIFLTLLFFEKNAVAVVRPTAGKAAQLVENQPVSLSNYILKKAAPHFLGEIKSPVFSKKSNPEKPDAKPKKRQGAAGLLLFGMMGMLLFPISFLLETWLLWVLICLFLLATIAFGIIAIKKPENRRLSDLGRISFMIFAWMGIGYVFRVRSK